MFEIINQWEAETYMAPRPIVIRIDLVAPLYNPEIHRAMEKYVVLDALNDIDELEEHEIDARPTWRAVPGSEKDTKKCMMKTEWNDHNQQGR